MFDYLTTIPRKIFCIAFLASCFLLLFFCKDNYVSLKYSVFITSDSKVTSNASGYLVFSSKCKIPDLDPFNSDAKPFIHPEKYTPCRKKDLLTYVTKTDNIATLHVDSEIVPSYSKNGVTCCYSLITRGGSKYNPDDGIKIGKCLPFENNTILTEDVVTVKCKDAKSNKTIYENTHTTVLVKEAVRGRMLDLNSSTPPLSVLFVGIDSISRLHLMRALPNTYNFVRDNGWISLDGYNKIDDNTFPNVMAILTGLNQSRAYQRCNPKERGRLDRCPIVWYDFRRLGYVTAYAEDDAKINTFNYKKKGFTAPPTDYYFRPYMLAAERLKMVHKDGMIYCTGPETAGERVFNAARDFVRTFLNAPSFGFFWTNSFSHNELNSPTGMDNKVRQFLADLTDAGVLERSLVIFLSDHGMRFGRIRYTRTGWLEERLPFVFVSLPAWFKQRFQREYANLLGNANRLTTPYDVHMTLQHVLVLAGLNHTVRPSDACPQCRSLFLPAEVERSCEDAAIAPHWCTCAGYTPVEAGGGAAMRAVASFAIGEIAAIVRSRLAKGRRGRCADYGLNRVISASLSEGFSYKNDTYALVVFETQPQAVFEATVLVSGNYSLVGGISRLDSYSSHSSCVDDAYLKMYCYCRW